MGQRESLEARERKEFQWSGCRSGILAYLRISFRTVELVFGKTRDLMPVSGGKIMKDHCSNHAFMIEELRKSWKGAGLQTAIEEGFVGRPFLNQVELDQWWKDPVVRCVDHGIDK